MAAIADAGTSTNGITCDDTDFSCVLEAGDYTLGGNINLAKATLGTTEDYSLYFSTGSTSLDLGGKSLTMGDFSTSIIGGDAPNKTVSIKNGTLSGVLLPAYGNITLSGLDFNGVIGAALATVNITSGTYTSDNALSVIMSGGGGGTYNISGGTFKTTGDGIPVINMNNGDADNANTLNITGGTFTANGVAIDLSNEPGFAEGPVVLNISGGTFTGTSGGLQVIVPSLNTVNLTGGTFTATGTGDGVGAIVTFDGLTSSISGFLGAGYEYTNDEILVKSLGFGGDIAYIAGTTTVQAVGSGSEEEAATSEDAATGESVGTPDSGALTTKSNGDASASGFVAVMVASLIATGVYFATRKKSEA